MEQSGGAPSSPRRADSYLLPTLFDRLRDDAPHRQTEVPGEYAVTRTQLRDIIQRDLAYLLNATNLGDLIDPQRYPLVAASTVNFGVPPLAGAFMASRKWADIEKTIKDAIGRFEPRLITTSESVSLNVRLSSWLLKATNSAGAILPGRPRTIPLNSSGSHKDTVSFRRGSA
ncbi:type VI secretion system baseplate subunit TssE [Paraburkholderia xenovorans]|nr:type VI secretion system baseplate subunit TssE [Paraburkholderia xenovorans]